MSTHTKAPWTARARTVSTAAGRSIATVWTTEADARLIAAAPDLLAALLRCRSELAWIEARDRGSIDNARSLADAAIAKATGDQP